LAGSGNLSGSLSKLAYQIEANLSGSGGLSVSALLNLAAAAQFAGVGGLSGDASSRAPIMAEAIFAGSGNLSANLNGILAALANLDGSGSFLGDLILAASAPVPDNAIATTNYSLHPVNCLMIDKGPLSSLKKKVTEWNIPKPDTKERATATKSQPAKLVKRLTIPKSWLQ
jgi:hypothetical protein